MKEAAVWQVYCGSVFSGVVLVALKLGGAIEWSWWTVMAPFWGFWLLGCCVCVVLAVAIHRTHPERS